MLSGFSGCPVLQVRSRRTERCMLITVECNNKHSAGSVVIRQGHLEDRGKLWVVICGQVRIGNPRWKKNLSFYSVDVFKPATNAGGIPILLISDAVHVHSLHTALWASEQMKWDVQEFVLQRGMCPSFIFGCCLGLVGTAPSCATTYSKVIVSF